MSLLFNQPTTSASIIFEEDAKSDVPADLLLLVQQIKKAGGDENTANTRPYDSPHSCNPTQSRGLRRGDESVL